MVFSFTSKEKDRFIEIIYAAYRETQLVENITFEILRWTFEIDYAYSDDDFIMFLEFQRYDIAQELILNKKIRLSSAMFQMAIDTQSIPAIEWLSRNGCPQEGVLRISAWMLCCLINEKHL